MKTVPRATAWVSIDPGASTSLFYALQVDPAPLTASLSMTEPSYESVTIVITNNSGTDVSVKEIDIRLDIGKDATDLTFTTAGIETSVSDTLNWSISGAPTVPITSGPFSVALTAKSGPFVTLAAGASVVAQVARIQASLNPGTSTVTITETLVNAGAETSFAVTTFPYGFYFNGLTAYAGTGMNLPVAAQVDNGSQVTLTWNCSVLDPNAFVIRYSDPNKGEQTVTPTKAGEWTTPAGVTADTTFVLIVSAKTTAGDPIEASMSLVVGVRGPALVAASLTTTGDIQAQGVVSGIGICPPGTVIMFTGDIAAGANFDATGKGIKGSKYEGWQVCNGQNGSIDLRDKFIAGAGNQYKVGQPGGEDQVTLSQDQMPTHNHGAWTDGSTATLNYPGVQYCTQGRTTGIMVNVQTDDPNGNRPNMLTTKGHAEIMVNNHTHGIENAGSSAAHENRPQFVALGYLVRT